MANKNPNKSNLKPPIKTTERARMLGSKGGKKKTLKKKQAAQLREFKKKLISGKVTDKEAIWMAEMLQNKNMTKLELLKTLKKIMSDPKIPQTTKFVFLERFDKRLYGEKSQVEQTGYVQQDIRVAEIVKIVKEEQDKVKQSVENNKTND